MKISQAEFIRILHEKYNGAYLIPEIEDFFTMLKEELEEQMILGNQVNLRSFGTFKPKKVEKHKYYSTLLKGWYDAGGYYKPFFEPARRLHERMKAIGKENNNE